MRIMVAHRMQHYLGSPVETYARSMIRTLREMEHEVVEVTKKRHGNYDGIDLLLDVDCGRDEEGRLLWHASEEPVPCPSAVYLIDSHGKPTIHKRLAPMYDHVFFCVWDKRDLFVKHPSAHWCPNFTDLQWFNGMDHEMKYEFDFGFLGSRGGLERADPMIELAAKLGKSATAREIQKGGKHRWPNTAIAMARCRNLFNCAQKHDGPNLRVMESMALIRPLICDVDPRGGMERLFTPWKHFIPYQAYTYQGLEEAMLFCIEHPNEAAEIARNARTEVENKHLVKHRLEQILEVVNES